VGVRSEWLCAAALVSHRWYGVATYRPLWRPFFLAHCGYSPLAALARGQAPPADSGNDLLWWDNLGDEVRQDRTSPSFFSFLKITNNEKNN
jgi:hypothetical protein